MTVLRHSNGNIGGVNPLQYVFREDVQSFSINPVTHSGLITLKAGKAWNYLYATDETISCSTKEEKTTSGMKYTVEIKMLIPKDRLDVEVLLWNLNTRHLIINLADKNGISRFYGTMQCPMKKVGTLVKPANVEGYNGWELVFTGIFTEPPAYFLYSYGGGIIAPPAGT